MVTGLAAANHHNVLFVHTLKLLMTSALGPLFEEFNSLTFVLFEKNIVDELLFSFCD